MRAGLKALPQSLPWQWRIFFGLGTGASLKVKAVVAKFQALSEGQERLLNSGFTVQEKKGEINPFV
jgi:hypothetical protein